MKEVIDKRIERLETLKQIYLQRGDVAFVAQTWARLEELKSLKGRFSDSKGNWLS